MNSRHKWVNMCGLIPSQQEKTISEPSVIRSLLHFWKSTWQMGPEEQPMWRIADVYYIIGQNPIEQLHICHQENLAKTTQWLT